MVLTFNKDEKWKTFGEFAKVNTHKEPQEWKYKSESVK
jgi:hypothetical protein